ncbi:hypothetical protein FOMPIDRAFT_1018663 [Fomitopsis schrenkii]|uniref:Uncharacterized protein n=1 Tax=Fomitopsis schrenkii TaxID=2126942 RepID=S8DVW2_FOMSC|nr:hypothetical protein FOMPIDRAFT_1018663 [Fomitopsis schrenkii]
MCSGFAIYRSDSKNSHGGKRGLVTNKSDSSTLQSLPLWFAKNDVLPKYLGCRNFNTMDYRGQHNFLIQDILHYPHRSHPYIALHTGSAAGEPTYGSDHKHRTTSIGD